MVAPRSPIPALLRAAVPLLAVLLPAVGCCQVLGGFTRSASFIALNGPPAADIISQQINQAQSGLGIGSFQHSSITATASPASNAIAQLVAADQDVALTYAVPDRVWIDRLLIMFAVQRQIDQLLVYQDHLRVQYLDKQDYLDQLWQSIWSNGPPPSPRPTDIGAQLIQIAQEQINRLQNTLDAMTYSCIPVDFRNYHTVVSADLKYKDLLNGVGLMQTGTNGYVVLDNTPLWEIEGNTKATKQIYRK